MVELGAGDVVDVRNIVKIAMTRGTKYLNVNGQEEKAAVQARCSCEDISKIYV